MTQINKEFLAEIKKRKVPTIPNNPNRHWADFLADKVIEQFPDEELYTCAAGITPSGVIHFGNFRDITTNYAVVKALESKGKKARLLFSLDSYDRFRKVPAGVPDDYKQYLGLPVTKVPDPWGEYESYARRFEVELEEALGELDMDIEFRYQTDLFTSGEYVNGIRTAFQKRDVIAGILWDFMSDRSKKEKSLDEKEYKENYFPGSVYSRFTGKDTTQILDYDGDTKVTYRCLETEQEETIDFSKDFCVGLRWKTDWAMRWKHENVHFEPGGLDHGSPGGSYDTSTIIAKDVYDHTSPIFAMYQFIGIRGLSGKMSSSKGNAISPATLLEIYEPEILKWLYSRKLPSQPFDLAFDSEMIRQYGEFDREVSRYHKGKLGDAAKRSLEWSYADSIVPEVTKEPANFRQIASFGQIVQWDFDKMMEILRGMGVDYDEESVRTRLEKARAWVETYNEDEMIQLRDEINADVISGLSEDDKANITELKTYLEQNSDTSITDLDVCVYGIPKDESLPDDENKLRQRAFFTIVYQLLIGKDTGPRLSTFLWALDRDGVIKLLSV